MSKVSGLLASILSSLACSLGAESFTSGAGSGAASTLVVSSTGFPSVPVPDVSPGNSITSPSATVFCLSPSSSGVSSLVIIF